MKVSCCMIASAGGDPDALTQSLRSIVPFIDEMCVLFTVVGDQHHGRLEQAAKDVCEDFDVTLRTEVWIDEEGNAEEGWISSFAEARNRAQAMATGDVWCWIDTDTILVYGIPWRADVERYFGEDADPRMGVMQVNYLYDFEEDGTCNRTVDTRMVFRAGISRWVWPVHEQAELLGGPHPLFDATGEKYHLRHLKPRGDHKASTRRNLWILENHMRQGRQMGARHWLSLAQAQMGLEKFDAALVALRECFRMEPGELDRWRALSSLGAICNHLGENQSALEAYGEMAALHPERSSPWVYIGRVLMDMGKPKQALAAVARAQSMPPTKEGPTENPWFLKWSPVYTEARACADLGENEQAIAAYERLLEMCPSMEGPKAHLAALRKQRMILGMYKAHQVVAETSGPEVWERAPNDLEMLPEVARTRLPKRPKDKQVVMIFCGPGASGPWGPSDLEKGVGGSEEAVIYLSRELAALGLHVEVYAHPHIGESGTDSHGVNWCHYSGWVDKPGVFIQWRGVGVIPRATKADARYVWLHDVIQDPGHYTDALKEQLDGVFCLSEFHARPLLEKGWGDKVVMTKNGLPPDVLEMSKRMEGRARQPRNSFAYYSSPDRGLDKLLEVWRDIRYAIPDATLDIYYGFTGYYLKAMQSHPHLRRLKQKIEAQLDDLQGVGVTWHGMVGQKELHLNMANTAFWLYPTAWPETSCITGMKCQALGCVPITSRYPDSGVPETVQYDLGPEPRGGSIYEDFEWMTAWKDRVIEVAKASQEGWPYEEKGIPFTREEMMEWARQHYDWSAVAEQWKSLFPGVAEQAASKPRRSRGKVSSPAS